jgi:uncharacterized protein (DUF1778 family)
MATDGQNDTRLNFRLPAELKETLVEKARHVFQETNVRKLSNRDRDIFIAMLDNIDGQPNERLLRAVAKLDEEARSFYLRYGFTSLADDRHHLYLPMHVIRKSGLPPPSP